MSITPRTPSDFAIVDFAVAQQKLAFFKNSQLCSDLNEKCSEYITAYITADVVAKILFITWSCPPYTLLRVSAMWNLSATKRDIEH